MSEKKKINKVALVIIGTIYNVLLLLVFFMLYITIFSLLAQFIALPDVVFLVLLLLVMVLSFVSSLFVYRSSLQWALKKLGYEDPFSDQKRLY